MYANPYILAFYIRSDMCYLFKSEIHLFFTPNDSEG